MNMVALPKVKAFYSNLDGEITQVDKLTERTFRVWDRNGYACLVSDFEEITIKESK